MWRSVHRCRRRDNEGFALPLAVAGAMLLLLSSSSLQMLALHNRTQLARQHRRLQIEDTLASAAHQQIARLAEHGSCLLGLDQAQWSAAAADCAGGRRCSGNTRWNIRRRWFRVWPQLRMSCA